MQSKKLRFAVYKNSDTQPFVVVEAQSQAEARYRAMTAEPYIDMLPSYGSVLEQYRAEQHKGPVRCAFFSGDWFVLNVELRRSVASESN